MLDFEETKLVTTFSRLRIISGQVVGPSFQIVLKWIKYGFYIFLIASGVGHFKKYIKA